MSTKRKPLVLWGGTDINPAIYGDKPHPHTQSPNNGRDATEIALYREAVKNGTPVIGVCRGAQLICALNGGTLYQHTQPHKQNHSIITNDATLFTEVAAGHHQIMNPQGEFEILAWNPAEVVIFNENETFFRKKYTAEVVWYPQTNSLAIQPHPEWASKDDSFVAWINSIISRLEIDYEF